MDFSVFDKLIDRANEAMGKKLTTKDRKKLKSSTFCGPDRSFPVPDCKHVATAKAYLGRSKFSKSTKKKIAACINRKAKQLGCDVSKPAKAAEEREFPLYRELSAEEKRLYSSDIFTKTRELVELSINNPGMDLFGEDEIDIFKKLNEVAKIVGSKSLPTSDKTDWDGAAAKDRMKKHAGGPDKDNINWSTYAKGFVYVDADDKENFGSYKLPFADVIGNELKAVKGGVYAAMAAVNGARGGVKGVDRKKAYNFLKSYYKKFDEDPPEFNE